MSGILKLSHFFFWFVRRFQPHQQARVAADGARGGLDGGRIVAELERQ